MTTAAADQRRADKAVFCEANSGQWAKCWTKDGRKLYAIPSATRPGLRHLANQLACSCEAFQHRGDCYHRAAVVLHVARVRAAQRMEGAAA